MRVVGEHLSGDVASDSHNRRVTGLRFRKLGNGLVPEIVEPEALQWTLDLAEIGLAFLVATHF